MVTEHGYDADYVKGIQKNPRVRVQFGRRWYCGTARLLPGRRRPRAPALGAPAVNDPLLRAVGTQQLTIRVDLDPTAGASASRRGIARRPRRR